MVAFNIEGREVWQIITFLRTSSLARSAGQAPGNAGNGAKVFQANGCARCHTVGLNGGFAGPDLTIVGARLTLDQLAASIINPDAAVDADYWSIRAKTKTGAAANGIRLNEDMDSIQIREAQGHLRTLRKADLASFEIVRTSPMPSFKDKLGAADLRDLVAYLASLRPQMEGTK